MQVVVLGAGVIGVTTAWYLAQDGHQVTVIDRQPEAGLETSFANAGEISPGYSAPWAGPGVPVKAIKWLMMTHPPLILGPRPDPAKVRWMAQMLANCNARAYAVNKARMVRLAEYSRDCLTELRAATGIRFDDRQQGTLQLFRSQKQVDAAAKDIAVLRDGGVPYEVLDRDGCIAAEPGLSDARDKIAGGLRLPNDETGDCFIFTQSLATLAAQAGVEFRHGVTVQSIETDGARVTGIRTDQGLIRGDAYVLALGSHSPVLARPLGLRLPVYPVKGYSITLPITDDTRAPQSTIMDETHKIAITRLGDRIRVGGMAEVAGYDLTLHERRRGALVHSVEDLFPGAGDQARATFWTGLRPMTPDGTPLVGPTRLGNLFLNTGHGTLGWTMAAGSGRVLADLIAGQTPAIRTDDLSLSRYAA
ncbi:D-amino acid dehydrogenase [Paracoccus sp. p4-l81]|uniref:D-amino acid dehydrogenase n=1 Tax=unclassified Paracoccus (in: a-proteobacteria) TaxID=2688777 RepID=UPI0035B8AC25